ncbi:MAG: hypothetical protein NTZ93_03680 [Candidatus Beckwithbacteria bacterium]|nr:hypothetical protein [Candidatus Beckwithbacteria bacterium]
MISFQVSIKQAAGQGSERETVPEPIWQPAEIAKNKGRIWKPTQKGEFLADIGHPEERQEEGVFIFLTPPYQDPRLKGIKTAQIISRGKAEVFIRQGMGPDGKYTSELCLIERDRPKAVSPGITVVTDRGLEFEKRALIIFHKLGETADIFLRVDGKLTGETRIECQEK